MMFIKGGLMTSVTIRLDETTKREASAIAEDFGFDLSSITRAFYRQMIREQRIPLTLEYPRPSEESRAAIRETDAILAEERPGYASAAEMFQAMGL